MEINIELLERFTSIIEKQIEQSFVKAQIESIKKESKGSTIFLMKHKQYIKLMVENEDIEQEGIALRKDSFFDQFNSPCRQLHYKLADALQREDFELAALIKIDIESLKSAVTEMA